ncbi:glucanase b [Phlyctema vagabunda]|uniref:Glucanase b n=1 Tax=Phlyctema vagabunda TaxID=108571 RepID=A0ABR4PPC8_9HELO
MRTSRLSIQEFDIARIDGSSRSTKSCVVKVVGNCSKSATGGLRVMSAAQNGLGHVLGPDDPGQTDHMKVDQVGGFQLPSLLFSPLRHIQFTLDEVTTQANYYNKFVSSVLPMGIFKRFKDKIPKTVLPQAVQHPQSTMTQPTLNIDLLNKTSSDNVFAFITGQDLNKSNHVVLVKADGKSLYYPDSPSEILQPLKEDCAIKLGAPGSTTTVTIPQIAGGRIWFSIDSTLTFLINPGPAVVEPSVSNPTDPSINARWGFCEFTYNSSQLYANISYVDFVSIPIAMALVPGAGPEQKVLGLKPDGLDSICAGLEKQGGDWAKLIVKAGDKNLRVLSPNNGIVMNHGELFKGYYDDYVNQVWSQYEKCKLSVDTQAEWGKVDGQVAHNELEFQGVGAKFCKPSTGDIFSCSTGPFANNAGATGPLTARISAGLNRSTLLNNTNHPHEEKVEDYYKHQVTNHYARLVHEANIDGRGYAFPYDDVAPGGGGIDQSGFVSDGNPKSFIVTIGVARSALDQTPGTNSSVLSGSPNSRLGGDVSQGTAATTSELDGSQNVFSFRRLIVSPTMSNRLLQTYFNFMHHLWPLLYKPMYSSLDYSYPTSAMPPVLVSAIYALAACVREVPRIDPGDDGISDTVETVPDPKVFFQDALLALQMGIGEGKSPHPLNGLKPSITNCQALVILAIQQHGVAEYPSAAMLCGLASAMAIELRLHRPYGADDPVQVEVRSRLWWNLFIAEKMLSCEMGRPVILRSEEVDTPYPSINESDEFELMVTWGKSHTTQPTNRSIKLRTMSILHTSIGLAIIMERLSREIYSLSARKAIRNDQAAGEEIRMKLWLVIQEWEQSLETLSLKLDLNDEFSALPGVVTNCVILWNGTILLHRPFIERWQSNPAYPESMISPHELCFEAANKICITLEKYADLLPGLPCDTIFAIFTAASTLLYHIKQNPSETETRRKLKLCIHWLSVLGKSWKSAGARRQLLTDLYDLPRELSPPRAESLDNLTQESYCNNLIDGNASGILPHVETEGNSLQVPMEEWAFLRDFGDSTDDFYALDVELRGLLYGQFAADSNVFLQ